LPHERLCIVVPLVGVDPRLAEACMRILIERHATLRSRFEVVDGELAIGLNPPEEFEVETASVTGDGGLAEALESVRLRLLALPIRIQDPWLARGRIVERDGEAVGAALVAHHMVLDARSLVLLEKELRALIEAKGDASALQEAPQYVHYGAWERDWLDREGGPLLAWWRDWLQDAPALTTPNGRPLVWSPGNKAYWDATFTGSGVERLRRLTAAANCTGFTAVLAVTAFAASRWAQQSRFPVRVIGDLRTSRALASMVGNLVCTDLVDMRAAEGASVLERLRDAAVEYTAACRLRLPNLLGLPDSPTFPDVRPGSIGAKTALTLNYLPIYAFRGALPPLPDQAPVAAPLDQSEHWPTPMCPINLRVWDYGPRLYAKMEFNGDLITTDEQRRFAELFAAGLVELSDAALAS
jgi:hypothetical protein